MNLSQQLEDKKKELESLEHPDCMGNWEENQGEKHKICQAEIAILEQAIAEIKNIQSQQMQTPVEGSKVGVATGEVEMVSILSNSQDSVKRSVGSIPTTADISKLLQKQRQEIFTILNKLEKKYSEIMTYVGEQPEWMKENKIRRNLLLEIKDKLNQPKTEQ